MILGFLLLLIGAASYIGVIVYLVFSGTDRGDEMGIK